MPSALLFDLDDTLVDRQASIRIYAGQFQHDFAAALQPDADASIAEKLIRADCGGYRNRVEASAELTETLPWTALIAKEQLHAHWKEHFPHATQARPDALGVLRELQALGFVIGLLTNGSTLGQNRKIDRLGLRPFLSSIIVSETVGLKKPDPAIFHLALAQLGKSPEEAWFIGDHPLNDMIGSAAAGLTPVWLRGMHAWPQSHPRPSLQIDRLDEIPTMIAAANASP